MKKREFIVEFKWEPGTTKKMAKQKLMEAIQIKDLGIGYLKRFHLCNIRYLCRKKKIRMFEFSC